VDTLALFVAGPQVGRNEADYRMRAGLPNGI
jgi:hypothetical protein